jgi:hypothetical protein
MLILYPLLVFRKEARRSSLLKMKPVIQAAVNFAG